MKATFLNAAFSILILSGLTSCANSTGAAIQTLPFLSEKKYEIPFQLKNGWIILQITLRNKPLNFIFDTGASGEGLRLDSAGVSSLNLPITDTMRMRNPANNETQLVPATKLSNAFFEGNFQLQNLSGSIRNLNLPDVAGVIGLFPFKDFLLTIDYRKKKIILEQESLPAPDNMTVLAYKSMRGIPTVKIMIGDKEYDAHFDTGNKRSKISMSKQNADKLTPLTSPIEKGEAFTLGQRFKIYSLTINETIQIGEHRFEKPEISYPLPVPFVNFGNQFLSQFKLTFDQKNERLRMVKDK